MNLHKTFSLVILLVFLTGCAAPTQLLPTSTPVPPMKTLSPTKAVIPPTQKSTATASATATPYPPLSTKGPYFAYLRKMEKQATIVFLDTDLVGRKEILLPDDISRQMYDLNNMSPDGKWLAYYTGEPEAYNIFSSIGIPPEGPYNLALNLYNLETKESRYIAQLLSGDFPNNFQKQADIFAKTGIPGELNYPNVNISIELYGSFLHGIDSLVWSPDGRYLAFAGQMNGLSSDLYIYDTKSETIRQLSSGSEEIQWISWSPDGKGILHGSAYVVGVAMKCRTYIADLDGSSVRYLSNSLSCFQPAPEDWIDNFTYLEYDSENVIGSYHLRSVDTQTGSITTYWDGAFAAYAVNLENGQIALNAFTDTLPLPTDGFTRGLYLINVASRKQIRLLDGMWFPKYLGLGERRFVILTGEAGKNNLFLKADGTLAPMESNYETILVAPDQQHWVGTSGDEAFVFSTDDTLIREINLRKISRGTSRDMFVTWSPDSSGFYFQFRRNDSPLYFVSLLSGDPILIDKTPSRIAFKWISAHP